MRAYLTPFSSSHMRPHFSLLFFITFSLIPCANADSQDSDTQPTVTFESDTYAKWAEFMSFFEPANIESSFISSLLGNHFLRKSDNVQREPHAPSDSLGSGPKPSLEVLLSEETGRIIRSLENMINNTLTLGMALYDVLESASSDDTYSGDVPLNPLLKTVANVVVAARDDFRARFPFPATAPGHAARVKSVSEALGHLQRLFIHVAKNRGVEEGVIERNLARVRPLLHDVGVLIGDVSELYPAAIEALVLHLSAVLLPEAVFLRSLVILYCFGPYVLGRDAISGWLLKHASEVLRL